MMEMHRFAHLQLLTIDWKLFVCVSQHGPNDSALKHEIITIGNFQPSFDLIIDLPNQFYCGFLSYKMTLIIINEKIIKPLNNENIPNSCIPRTCFYHDLT